MKRKFVSAMLFGALTLAVGTSVTGCNDYDDDIQNLQSQIDKLSSTNPVTSEDIKTAVDAAKTELQKQLDELKQQIGNKADAGLSADVEGLEKKISDLESKIAELDNIKTRLGELELAEKEYEQSGSLAAYESKAGLTAYINQKIADALADNSGAIAAYIEEAVKNGTLLDLNRLNTELAKITGPTGSLTQLQQDFERYVTGTGNEALLKRVADLETYSSYIEQFIADGKGQYETFADVLAQIETTRAYVISLSTPDGEAYNDVKAIVTEELKTVNSDIETIEGQLEKLGLDVEAIKKMIQSIVYVPSTLDQIVHFTTLYAKANNNTDWNLISSSQAVEVKFRVSPASAVAGFADNYTVEVYDEEVSRAGSAFTVDAKSVQADEKTGIVTMTLAANDLESDYVICLHVTGKKAEGEQASDFVTDVTSDYFSVQMDTKYMDNAKYVSTQTGTQLVYDKDETLDFLTGGHYELHVADDKASSAQYSWVKLSDLGVDESLFSVTFEQDAATAADEDYFTLDNGVLGVKNAGQTSSIGKKTKVKYTVSVKGNDKTYADTYANEVEIVRGTGEMAPIEVPAYGWDGTSTQEYTLTGAQMDAIYNEAGLTKAEFNALAATAFDFNVNQAADAIKFAFVGQGSNDLKVVIPAGSNGGVAEAKIQVTESLEITIKTSEIVINYMTEDEVALVKNSVMWDGDNVFMPVGVDANQATTAQIGFDDLTALFSNYDDIHADVTAVGGEIKFEASQGSVSGTGTTYSLDATAYDGKPLTLSAKVMFGNKQVGPTYTANLIFDIELSGTLTVPAADKRNIEVSAADRANAVKLTTGFKWNDYRGKTMWPTVDAQSFTYTAGVDALGMYGLEVRYELSGAQKDMFTLDAGNGTVTLKNEYAQLESVAADITVYVDVIAESPWGNLQNSTTRLTVTIERWAENE